MIREAVEAGTAKYGAIIVGLAIGTAAKYGLLLTDGKRLTLRGAFIDLLLLGMLGFIAVVISDGLHLEGNAKVLVGALAAVSSDRLVRIVRDRFEKGASAQIGRLLPPVEREAIMRIPAGIGEPSHVDVQVPSTTARGQMSVNLKRSYGDGDRPIPRDQQDELDKLDGD